MSPLDEINHDGTLNDVSVESVDDLITKGRRNLICKDYYKAVECLEKACAQLAEQHGDLDEKLAEPNFLYGSALLELALSENQIFEGPDENQSESDNSDTEQEIENPTISQIDNQLPELCENPTNGIDADESHEIELIAGCSKTENMNESINRTNEKNDEDLDDGDDTDVSNLQLAWEVFEVAKTLFGKKDDAYSQLRVADCLDKLSEISREKDDNEQSISDLLECLYLRVKHLENDQRLIAETHFRLGIGYSLVKNKDLSNASFDKSILCLKQAQSDLENTLRDESSDSIKVELKTKIEDLKKVIIDVEERRQELQCPIIMPRLEDGITLRISDKFQHISDVSHLIKRKQNVEDVTDAKRRKLDDDLKS